MAPGDLGRPWSVFILDLGAGRLGIDDPALLAPVALLTVLNLSADAFLAYAVTRGAAVVGTLIVSAAQAASR